MPGAQTQPLPPKLTINTTKGSVGLQLLSPTLQQTIQKSTSKISTSHSAEYCDWSTTPRAGESPIKSSGSPSSSSSSSTSEDEVASRKDEPEDDTKVKDNSRAFDFDGFTLASVREREKQRGERDGTEMSASSSSRASRTNSIDPEKPQEDTTDYSTLFGDEYLSLKPLSRSMASIQTTTASEDFELSRRQRHYSFNKQIERASITSRPTSDYTCRNTFQLSTTAASPGFKKKDVSTVTMRGWLQKRKGVVLKRWKIFFCLLKSDDSLCLFSSEDTVNGRLVQQYQVLKVLLTEKKDAFHIIGVDTDGAPRREEFRTIISFEWTRWSQALGKYFDKDLALDRKRGNSILPTYCGTEGEQHRHENQCSIDPRTSGRFNTNDQAFCDSLDGSGDDHLSLFSSFSESSGVSVSAYKEPKEDATPLS